MQAGAVDSAVAYLRRALDEHPFSGQLLFELGAAEVLTSGPAAAEHLTLRLRDADRPARPRRGGRAARPRADVHGLAGGRGGGRAARGGRSCRSR